MPPTLSQDQQQQSTYPLFFARHGSTKLNEDSDKIRGWLDVPLSPKGEAEAQKLGNSLKDKGIQGIIASDLTRTQQTAKIVSDITGIPIVAFTKGLRPWNVGVATGHPAGDIGDELYSLATKYADAPLPGGESFNTFKQRYLTEIQAIMKQYPSQTMLAVAHHRNNVLLDAWIASGAKPDLSIDADKFLKHGVDPADFKLYQIPKVQYENANTL